jgi:PAS domain S-box-containing protein
VGSEIFNATALRVITFAFSLTLASTAFAIDKVSLQLRWDHQFQFAGYYAAKWQGYYAQENIEADIRSAVPSPNKILSAIREVSDGRADFGIGSADILIGREKGAPLIVLASIFQTSASAFYSLKKTPINGLASLRNLKVARRHNDLIDVEFQAMLRAEGIDPAKIKAYPHESGIEHLTSGRVDIIPGYRISIPFNTNKASIQVTEILPSRYGVDFYGDSLFTHGNLIQRNPDLVRRFVAASLKGWQYALQHPEEIAQRIARELPRNSPVIGDDVLGFNKFQVTGVKELVLFPLVKIGNINPERWGRMHAALSGSGLLTGAFNAEELIFDPIRRNTETLRSYLYITLGVVVFALFVTALAFAWSRALRRQVNLVTRELSESEARLSAIFDSAPFVLALKDVDGKYFYSNQKFLHGLKQTRQSLQEMHARDLYDPELLPLMEEMDDEVLRTVQPVNREMVLGEKFDPPGTREVIKFPVLDKSEHVSGIGIISVDITARKQAEAAVINSENRFRDFANAASDVLWELDADLRLTYISDRYADLTGRPTEFLSGKIPAEISSHPADDATKIFQEKLQQRVSFRDYVFERVRPDGSRVFFSSSGVPVYSPEGEFEGFRGTLRDISELKRTTEYLELISTAFDSIAEVVAVYDANDILIYVNQALKSLDADIPRINQLGITFEQRMQLLADNMSDLDESAKEAWLATRLEQHRNPGAPFEFSRTPGSTYLFHEQRLPDGSTFNIGHNISAQKSAAEDIRISEERFRATFESSALGNIVISAHGIIEAVNAAAEKTFGYSDHELIGKNVSMLMSEPDQSAHDGYLENYLKTGDAKIIGVGRDVLALRKNGQKFPAHLGVGEMVVDGRKSFLGSITDLTTLKAMETQIAI